jgi:hypothetical protein
MRLDPNFREFIELMNSEGVRYLLLGGYAVNFHGHHRFTGDIDFWIATDQANAHAVSSALQRFGFSAASVPPESFIQPGKIHMFGRVPLRIDLLTQPSGVDFDTAWSRRIVTQIDETTINVISLHDLRINKQASGRDKDLADLRALPPSPASPG